MHPPLEHEAAKELGRSYQAIGDFPEAERFLLRSLGAQPRCTGCWVALARLYGESGEPSEVPTRLREAVPDSPALGGFRGYALEVNGFHQDALEEYSEGIQANPNDPWALWARGDLLANLGDWGGARRDADAPLRLVPRYPAALELRARAKLEASDASGALEDFEAALRIRNAEDLDPGELNDLGVLRARFEHFDEAIEAYDAAAPDASGDLVWMLAYNKAVAATLRDGLAAGNEQRETARTLIPDDAPAGMYALAGLLAVEGNATAAFEALKALRSEHPEIAAHAETDPAWAQLRLKSPNQFAQDDPAASDGSSR